MNSVCCDCVNEDEGGRQNENGTDSKIQLYY